MAEQLRKKTKPLIYCTILIVLVFTAGLSGCSSDIDQRQIIGEDENIPMPDQESWNSTLTTTDLGNLTAEIEFGHMAKFNEKNEYQFDQNLKVFLFDENGKLKNRITSERGLLNEKNKIMEAFGNVIAHSDSANMTLFTERLKWDETLNKIVSNVAVKFTTDLDTVYGDGFESDMDFRHYHIKNPRGRTTREIDLINEKKTEQKKYEK